MAVAAGDILYRGASAWLRLPKGSDDKVLMLSSGLPSWQTETATASDLSAIRDQIQYLLFRDDQAVGLNGLIYDGFASDTLATKTNATWNAGGYYANTTAAGSDIDSYSESNQDGQYDIRSGAASGGIGQAITLSTAARIYSAKFYLRKQGSPTGNLTAYIYSATGTVGTNATPTGSALATSSTVDASTVGASFSLVEFVFPGGYSAASGDYVVMVSGSFASPNYIQAGLDTSGPTSAGNECYNNGSWIGESGVDLCFHLVGLDVNNMTLIPSTATATATPSKARISAFVVPVDSVTLNTDLLAYATANNGSNWDQITLSKVADLASSVDQYTGEVTLTSASTTMAWKLVSANNKSIQVTGCGLAWY